MMTSMMMVMVTMFFLFIKVCLQHHEELSIPLLSILFWLNGLPTSFKIELWFHLYIIIKVIPSGSRKSLHPHKYMQGVPGHTYTHPRDSWNGAFQTLLQPPFSLPFSTLLTILPFSYHSFFPLIVRSLRYTHVFHLLCVESDRMSICTRRVSLPPTYTK